MNEIVYGKDVFTYSSGLYGGVVTIQSTNENSPDDQDLEKILNCFEKRYGNENYALSFSVNGRFTVSIRPTGTNKDNQGNFYIAYRTLEERVKAAAKAHPVVNPDNQKELLG